MKLQLSNKGLTVAELLVVMVLFCIAMPLVLGTIGLSIYGLYLAFSASIFLGLLALVVEPSPLVFGLVMLLAQKNLPQMIMEWLNK